MCNELELTRNNVDGCDESFTVILNFEASTISVVLTERLRPHLWPDLVHELAANDELQSLLREDREYQSQQGIRVLEAAPGNVDCLFLNLRENSMGLCNSRAQLNDRLRW
jgi:hypothetical protein